MRAKKKHILPPILHQGIENKTCHNFFSVCIKAIEDNKEGVINKNECIKNIMRLSELKFRPNHKKYFSRTAQMNYSPSLARTGLKFQSKNVMNKRRKLMDIIKECEKKEAQAQRGSSKAQTKISFSLDKENKIPVMNKEEKKEETKTNTKDNTQVNNINKVNTTKVNNNKDVRASDKRIRGRKSKKLSSRISRPKIEDLTRRHAIFTKITEYLESNNITLFEFLRRNPFQKRPYQISKGYEFLEAVKFKNYTFVKEALLVSNDYLFVFDYFGQTCYHWAAKLGYVAMLTILIDYGKYHNQKDFKGRTPLYLAAVNNNREICDLLIRHKANVYLRDNLGNSPADVAGSKELKYYLGDLMTQPYNNPAYKKRVADFLRKREQFIEKKEMEKKFKELQAKNKVENEEEVEENPPQE